jgi:hypothetical protein
MPHPTSCFCGIGFDNGEVGGGRGHVGTLSTAKSKMIGSILLPKQGSILLPSYGFILLPTRLF